MGNNRMAGVITENVNTREQIASHAHDWLRALTVDPLILREKHGMKGKKHLVELLLGYYDLYTFFESTGNQNAKEVVLTDARTALAVVADKVYHDLNEVDRKRFSEDSLSYLYACYFSRIFGLDTALYLAEITKILPRLYSHLVTRGACQRMAIVRRLGSLGLPATESIASLVAGTVIRQKKDIAKMLMVDVYLIVHEIAHLTDDGQHPADLLNNDDLQYLRTLFHELLVTLQTADGMDLLAEVIVAMQQMQMHNTPVWQRAVMYIAGHQNANGSFGSYEQQRQELAAAGKPYDVDIGMYLHATTVCLRATLQSDVVSKGIL
jgi:hypothetical protein